MFTPQQMQVISQGLLVPFQIRVPEYSDLFLNMLTFVLMNRHSPFTSVYLDSFMRDYLSDRKNLELISIIKSEKIKQISNLMTYNAVKKHMSQFEKFQSGTNYDFQECSIADIDAEYIRLPQNICSEWFKRNMVYFMNKTLLREDTSVLFKSKVEKIGYNVQ